MALSSVLERKRTRGKKHRWTASEDRWIMANKNTLWLWEIAERCGVSLTEAGNHVDELIARAGLGPKETAGHVARIDRKIYEEEDDDDEEDHL